MGRVWVRVMKKKIIYSIIAVMIISTIIYFSRSDLEEFIKLYTNAKDMENFIKSFGSLGPIIFMFFQILQVILFFIPGEFMQAVGGYLFGTILGTILSVFGIMFGSVITFFLAKKYGDKLLREILPQKDYDSTKRLICRPKNRLVIFILYLLPGFPKDVLGYVSGITTIRFTDFIIISSLARLPGILITSYLGSKIYSENYIVALCVVIGVAIILLVGVIKRDKVLSYFK
jgi:uncharacterized membrane protein YdjX (TVP38/TMEM64 family)